MTDDFIGYIKYSGTLVQDGVIDARSGARALTGFDTAVRYFVSRTNPELSEIEFPIPVRIQAGSWMAVIPQNAEQWVLAASGVVATAYATKAAGKIAENDFKDVGTKDIFRGALRGIQWIVRIAKHTQSAVLTKVHNIQWKDQNVVLIPNGAGAILEVPIEFFQLYLECPAHLLSDLASLIVPDRTLSIGVVEAPGIAEVNVSIEDRSLFSVDEIEHDEELFVELTHGMEAALDGIVTRGNAGTNSIGFRYHDHILNCTPRTGSIVRFKKHLFLPCRIFGTISRADEKGHIVEKKPKVIFDDLQFLGDAQANFSFDESG